MPRETINTTTGSSLRAELTTLAAELLRLPPGIICLTGGGGKTTLLRTLGAALSLQGREGRGARVLLTTSTRIQRPEPSQSPLLECVEPQEIRLPETPGMLIAARPAGPGQNPEYLRGFSAEEIDALWTSRVADWIVVEADGSACRPLKAPSAKEPVIPSLTVATVAVAGLSGLYRLFTDTWVFRPEQFSAVTGLRPGDTLLPEAVAAIFRDPHGLFKDTPDHARRFAFFNQTDIPGGLEAGIALARAVLLQKGVPLHGVFAGSAARQQAPCLAFSLEQNPLAGG